MSVDAIPDWYWDQQPFQVGRKVKVVSGFNRGYRGVIGHVDYDKMEIKVRLAPRYSVWFRFGELTRAIGRPGHKESPDKLFVIDN